MRIETLLNSGNAFKGCWLLLSPAVYVMLSRFISRDLTTQRPADGSSPRVARGGIRRGNNGAPHALSDPSPLQDFCVADLKATTPVDGFPCKPASTVVDDDFFSRAITASASTRNPFGVNATRATASTFPGLNTLASPSRASTWRREGSTRRTPTRARRSS
ncbi:hypothetical protein PR202_ga09965 [Eleusine coracana subsp. coracana]|uniref:Uncharacterized protein n=1 Tax=Eleusine coracana subsp. coracana TaxID=191504 RepID=A0AAV5C4Z2_ELECO|nr:hypothetical protein PR202_ga09965 [Eleusine coracana subsp. coracana]